MLSASLFLAFIAITILALVIIILTQSGHIRTQSREIRALSAQKRVLLDDSDKSDRVVRQVRTKQNWFSQAFDHTKDMVFVYHIEEDNLPGPFIEANHEACSRLGYTREDLLTRSQMDIEHGDVSILASGYSRADMAILSDSKIHGHAQRLVTNLTRRQMEQLIEKGTLTYESVFEDRNGETIPVEVYLQIYEFEDERLVICTAMDITERKAAERALNESRLRFHDFFANSPIGIAMFDADKGLLDVNLACLRMFGIPDREQFARFDLFNNPFIPEEARVRLARGESARYEAAIDFGEAIERSVFISRKTGTAYYDIQINNMGPGPDFRPRGYFAQVQDITERRKAESDLLMSEQLLRQAEKMEAIGSMAGGIAHDFNNILTPIIGYAQMLQAKSQGNPSVEKFAQGILKAANRAKELVAQILTFSRKSEGHDDEAFRAIHVIPIAKEVLVLQRTSLPENIEVNRIIKTDHDIVIADPTKLHQILMNLCTNAGHAMKGAGGVLEVRLTDFMLTGRSKGELRDLEPGRYLRISVKDTGTGMDKSVLDRIFEPFFTTKKKGEGTGMGLSVVHGIIKSFNGMITVESAPGKGSTFHVILPIAEKAVEETAATSAEPMPAGKEDILVVDDDNDVCEMTCAMLNSLGYQAASANHANGALRLFSIDPEKFDLVITDQVMPGMTGSELASQLLVLRPDLPIILCTGFSQAFSEEQALEMGIRHFMTKPIDMAILARVVRKLLDTPGIPPLPEPAPEE